MSGAGRGKERHVPPERSVVVRRLPIFFGTSTLLISFQPPLSSSELASKSETGSAPSVGFDVGGGGMSNMNQSWCAIRNSSTSWLSWCSCGDISCVGCAMSAGRKITAKSATSVH